MEKYIIDSGDFYNGQHVSDEAERSFYSDYQDALREFDEVVKELKNRENSYVYILKFSNDECMGIVKQYYS